MKHVDPKRVFQSVTFRASSHERAMRPHRRRAMIARAQEHRAYWTDAPAYHLPRVGVLLAGVAEDGSCHADVLLEIANRPVCEAVAP